MQQVRPAVVMKGQLGGVVALALVALWTTSVAADNAVYSFENWNERAALSVMNACRMDPDWCRRVFIKDTAILSDGKHYVKRAPLRYNFDLNRAARCHSQDMAINGCYQHNDCFGRAASQRLALFYKDTSLSHGESISQGSTPQATVFDQVCQRAAAPCVPDGRGDGHRYNLFDPKFSEVGVGYAVPGVGALPGPPGADHIYYTEDYGEGSKQSARPATLNPIYSGSHIFGGFDARVHNPANSKIIFIANYYDDTRKPTSAQVIVDNTTYDMRPLNLGTYIYQEDKPYPGCRDYVFKFVDASGKTWMYPELNNTLITYGAGGNGVGICRDYVKNFKGMKLKQDDKATKDSLKMACSGAIPREPEGAPEIIVKAGKVVGWKEQTAKSVEEVREEKEVQREKKEENKEEAFEEKVREFQQKVKTEENREKFFDTYEKREKELKADEQKFEQAKQASVKQEEQVLAYKEVLKAREEQDQANEEEEEIREETARKALKSHKLENIDKETVDESLDNTPKKSTPFPKGGLAPYIAKLRKLKLASGYVESWTKCGFLHRPVCAALFARPLEAGCQQSTKNCIGTTQDLEQQVAPKMDFCQKGLATWYFRGLMTTCEVPFLPTEQWAAAHLLAPCGTILKVTVTQSKKNPDIVGNMVIVVVTDRGPWKKGRVIDLTQKAAIGLGITKPGELANNNMVVPEEDDSDVDICALPQTCDVDNVNECLQKKEQDCLKKWECEPMV